MCVVPPPPVELRASCGNGRAVRPAVVSPDEARTGASSASDTRLLLLPRGESLPVQPCDGGSGASLPPLGAVLVDRDGTLVVDVPYNGDPARVQAMPGARSALDRLRRRGLPLAVVSNQSGIARGQLTPAQVKAVNARVEELLGPFEGFWICPHGPDDGCACRKPRPGLVQAAAAALGVDTAACAVVGDIGADVEAALAAGARPVLVPTPVTRPAEVAAAPEVAADLGAAVDLLLSGVPSG